MDSNIIAWGLNFIFMIGISVGMLRMVVRRNGTEEQTKQFWIEQIKVIIQSEVRPLHENTRAITEFQLKPLQADLTRILELLQEDNRILINRYRLFDDILRELREIREKLK